MPILKNKIAKSIEIDRLANKEQKIKENQQFIQALEEKNRIKEPRPKRTTQLARIQEVNSKNPKNSYTGNNIIKNYSRALIAFALSDLSNFTFNRSLNKIK